MARKAFPQVDLVIPSGQTDSNEVDIDQFGVARGFAIQAPANLSGTCSVECSLDGGTTFGQLQSGAVDITAPQGKVTVIDFMAWDKLKIKSDAGGGEGGTRTFKFRAVREY